MFTTTVPIYLPPSHVEPRLPAGSGSCQRTRPSSITKFLSVSKSQNFLTLQAGGAERPAMRRQEKRRRCAGQERCSLLPRQAVGSSLAGGSIPPIRNTSKNRPGNSDGQAKSGRYNFLKRPLEGTFLYISLICRNVGAIGTFR